MNNDEWLKIHITQINEKFNKVDEKLDRLLSFKYQVLGVAALSSIIVSIIVTIGVAFIKQT